MKNKIDTPSAILSLDENVLFVKMKANINLGLTEMQELLHHAVELNQYKKYFAIIDTQSPYETSLETRNYYSESEYTKYRYADAFIVNSLPMRLLVNFYISFHKPKIPTKMFNNEKNAIEWINSLKNDMHLNS
jgi:hypothetical protein